MSSFRTSLSSMRQRSEGSPWLPLLAGILLGLLIGLFVGWVVWPVEWQGAYLSDLTPESRAEYLSAVADSYVVYSSDVAREQARQRLSTLQGDVLTEIQTAMEFYRARPSQQNEIRIYNLAQLANAFGGQANPAMAQVAPGIQVEPGLNEVPVAVAPAANEVPVMVVPAADANIISTSVAENASGSVWFSRLLMFFAGLLLLGGGFYLLQQLRQGGEGFFGNVPRARLVGGRDAAEDDYHFADESEFATDTVDSAGTAISPWSNAKGEIQNRSTPVGRSVTRDAALADPDFDTDLSEPNATDDLDEGAYNWSAPPRVAAPSKPPIRYGEADNLADEVEDEEAYDVEFDDDAEEERSAPEVPLATIHPSVVGATRYEKARAVADDDEADFDDDDEESDDTAEEEAPEPLPPPTSPAIGHRSSGDNALQRADLRPQPIRPGSVPLPRYATSKSISSFDCIFYAGMGDYDESFNIPDPIGKGYIGECGMGVSTKNRILHKNPDEVIAFEIWLFDKTDSSNITSQMRVLLSEYASDHYADIFAKERNGEARPFVAQPGVRFQLEGPSLVLNGEIVEAQYNREGVFQNVKIHMDVVKR